MLLWLAAQFVALALAGAGHGWAEPFALSLALAVLYPAALIRAVRPAHGRRWPDVLLALAAIVLDAELARDMISGEPTYLGKLWELAPQGVAAWLLLWGGWQVAVLVGWRRRLAGT